MVLNFTFLGFTLTNAVARSGLVGESRRSLSTFEAAIAFVNGRPEPI